MNCDDDAIMQPYLTGQTTHIGQPVAAYIRVRGKR